MEQNPYAPDFKGLPETLPVFPLSGVLLLPMGNLPLNIFEKRYLKMVGDALGGNRLIGMIQPRAEGETALYDIGCAGKITEFRETGDGRYVITLTGISRFKIAEELKTATPYRQVRPDWEAYKNDLEPSSCLDLDRAKLNILLQSYFSAQEMKCDWKAVEKAPDGRLVTCLAMVCPFEPKEKQALLEAPCCKTRAEAFMTMLEMAVKARKECGSCH
ncbi:MAG: LON peptidase substrate-binding domain-containing protein [Alphaproteobacteria bacterium]